MDDKRIGEIVNKVFEKAKLECASHSKYALSLHISDRIDVSHKTLERAYNRYVQNKNGVSPPQKESIGQFCKYLGYDGYADYSASNTANAGSLGKGTSNTAQNGGTTTNYGVVTFIGIALLIVLMIISLPKWLRTSENMETAKNECMTWADSLYIEVSCATKPYSKYGTPVEPLDPIKLKNFKKVKVNMAYKFFTEDDKPLVWYYKTKEDEIEYFTAPGLHPTNGETLRKITPYIIKTYVPLHSNTRDSFLE